MGNIIATAAVWQTIYSLAVLNKLVSLSKYIFFCKKIWYHLVIFTTFVDIASAFEFITSIVTNLDKAVCKKDKSFLFLDIPVYSRCN